MKLTALVAGCAAALVACSGIEEIALNPTQPGTAGLANGGSAGAAVTSAMGSGGTGTLGGSAGSTAAPSAGGPNTAGHGGVAGQTTTIPPEGGTSSAACADDDSCPDAVPYCRADGQCVVCLNDSHCGGEDLRCELSSGSCVDSGCPGGGGSEAGGCSGL